MIQLLQENESFVRGSAMSPIPAETAGMGLCQVSDIHIFSRTFRAGAQAQSQAHDPQHKSCLSEPRNIKLHQQQQHKKYHSGHMNKMTKQQEYNSGPWLDEELSRFEEGFKKFGPGKWVEISGVVVTRSNAQVRCISHYCNGALHSICGSHVAQSLR